jgi:superfamily II DNA or RNA helicase
MSGLPYVVGEDIQVASIDTLDSRYFREGAEGDREQLGGFDLVIYDEAHTRAEMFQRVRAAYAGAFVVGLSATPAVPGVGGLGAFGYGAVVSGPSVRELMAGGYLVPEVRYFGPEEYDYSGVRVSRSTGEYVEGSADEVVTRAELVGNVVRHYLELGNDEPFVVFANSVGHSAALASRFNQSGVPVMHVDMNTSDEERDYAYSAIESGELRGLTNYGILDRGFDCPRISVCILARKVRNVTTYRQMVGRVLRTHESKDYCTVIDHGGNVARHGFIETEIEWPLEGGRDVNEEARAEAVAREETEARVVTCGECSFVYSGPRCPACGWVTPPRAIKLEELSETEAQLVRITGERVADQRGVYGMMLSFARSRGYSGGWADHAYREVFGVWPRFVGGKRKVLPVAPDEVWLAHLEGKVNRYRRQKFAIERSMAKRAAE